MTYASAEGRTLPDRELYLPRVWVDALPNGMLDIVEALPASRVG